MFTPAEADANRADFDRLLAMFHAAGKDSYAINGFHATCACLWDICRNPTILDYVEDLLGPNFIAWGTHYFCKLPSDGKTVSWHQDAPYWPLSHSKTVTAWIAIDDTDEGNAAMRIIPGSHRHGALPRRPSHANEHNVLYETVAGHIEDLGAPVSMCLKAGQISLHSDLMVHGSLANPGPRRRCGLTIRYCPVDVQAGDNWNANSIHCRGSDPSGHWHNVPRPTGNSPFGTHKTIGAN